MASPHPGMHILCPVCEGPIPDLLGELTDEAAGINAGTRATDCYYCEAALLYAGLGSLLVGPAQPPPAKRTAQRRDIKFGDASGLDAWRAAMEQALQDEANNPYRDPQWPPITITKMVGKQVRPARIRGIPMGMNACFLTPLEEAFLQALLWEEGRLLKGPATEAAEEHGLSLVRCLEPANRLSPNLQGEALNRLRQGPSPAAEWPWDELNGDEVLRLLWNRLAEHRTNAMVAAEPSSEARSERS